MLSSVARCTTRVTDAAQIILGGIFTAAGQDMSRTSVPVRLNSDGSLDTTFPNTDGVLATGLPINGGRLPNGKFALVGGITEFGAVARNRVCVVNSDGTLDTTFAPQGTSFNNSGLNGAVGQSDNKIIVTGFFQNYNGTSANYIARLNTDGTLDTSFDTGTGFNNTTNYALVQSDGKILVFGNFTSYNGTSINRVIRLNSDGSRDTTFNVGTGFNNSVNTAVIQPDGKIVMGGTFTQYNGTNVLRVARLNTDGTLDTSFNATGNGPNSSVTCLQYLSTGKILIGGYFSSYFLSSSSFFRANFTRLNSDGTLDTDFASTPILNNGPLSIELQSSGKIILGGFFTISGLSSYARILRLNTDGSLDTTFKASPGFSAAGFGSAAIRQVFVLNDDKIVAIGNVNLWGGSLAGGLAAASSRSRTASNFSSSGVTGQTTGVNALGKQSNNKIICAGPFTTYNNATANRIVRIDSGGSLDSTFDVSVGFNNPVNDILVTADDKIICGGSFTTYRGVSATRIIQLNSDGSADTGFSTGTGFNSTAQTLSPAASGKIMVGGIFTAYNGTNITRLARLNSDGTLDSSFAPGVSVNSNVFSICVLSSGKMLVGGQFSSYQGIARPRLVCINSDGTLDTAFNGGATTGFNSFVFTIVQLPSSKILVGGSFAIYNNITTGPLVRLNEDGSLDNTFQFPYFAGGQFRKIIPYGTDKFILCGSGLLDKRAGFFVIDADGNILDNFVFNVDSVISSAVQL